MLALSLYFPQGMLSTEKGLLDIPLNLFSLVSTDTKLSNDLDCLIFAERLSTHIHISSELHTPQIIEASLS